MGANDLLRKQVASELKKRRLIMMTFMILSIVYLSVNLIFGEMGLLRYLELNRTYKKMETQVLEISMQNSDLEKQIRLLKEDPFYKEKLARDEFGLAKPDEFIFHFEK